jgi:hypothetical protein
MKTKSQILPKPVHAFVHAGGFIYDYPDGTSRGFRFTEDRNARRRHSSPSPLNGLRAEPRGTTNSNSAGVMGGQTHGPSNRQTDDQDSPEIRHAFNDDGSSGLCVLPPDFKF